jgi:hypothetical protein
MMLCLQDIPRSVSTTDEWTLRQKSFLDGSKVRQLPGKVLRLNAQQQPQQAKTCPWQILNHDKAATKHVS